MTRQETTLDDPEEAGAPARWIATLRLLFTEGRIVERPAIELASGETLIGRAVSREHVLLDDPRVSRLHARIKVSRDGGPIEVSNESRRGTEVNGAPVVHATLNDGDVLTLGHTLLVFRWERRPPMPDAPIPNMIGSAPSIRAVRRLIATIASTQAIVTIHGETGTGKELVARALHDLSGRTGPFLAVNCSAIPEALAESQLFGHVAGAYTGARVGSEGLFRAASDGTLFLDEVGDLSASVQAKLLRALEAKTVMPVGSVQEVPHTARVVTATHRDLTDDVHADRFRRDLYARITDFVITVPPLRDRREDVLPLLRHSYPSALPPIDLALARALVLHSWPLNVRELVRLATQMQVHAQGAPRLALEHAAEVLERNRRFERRSDVPSLPPSPSSSSAGSGSGERERPPSREELEVLLRQHGGVVADVARATGRSRKQVYRWLHAYAMDPDAYRR